MTHYSNFSSLAGAAIQVFTGTVDALQKISDAKKQNRLAKDIGNLSYKQQVELENRLALVQTQIEKENVMFQFINLQKEIEIRKKISQDRLVKLFMFAGVTLLLGVVVLKLSRKNG